ncbi:MAG: hypothetical protein HFE49_02955 [Clostridia bacterium]|nr:hypothetical protein [Clostridia bacterium]
MEYENISQLISYDSEAMHYFNSLPAQLQQQILDRGSGVNTIDKLKSFQALVEQNKLS